MVYEKAYIPGAESWGKSYTLHFVIEFMDGPCYYFLNMDVYYKKTVIVLSLFLISGFLIVRDRSHEAGSGIHSPAGGIPREIGSWRGTEIPYDREMLEGLGADSTIFRRYDDPHTGRTIQLYLAYYTSMDKSDLSHSPLVCYQGQGWVITEQGIQDIYLSGLDKKIRCNRMIIQKKDRQELVLYWYQTKDKIFPRKSYQRIFLILDKFLGKSQENIWVRVSAVIPEAGLREVLATETDFISHLYPAARNLFTD